jgi:hypothetical protein
MANVALMIAAPAAAALTFGTAGYQFGKNRKAKQTHALLAALVGASIVAVWEYKISTAPPIG